MSALALHRRLAPAVPAGSLALARSGARALGFWIAVVLPLAYLPAVLFAPSSFADPATVAAAIGCNLAALLVGHGHEPGR